MTIDGSTWRTNSEVVTRVHVKVEWILCKFSGCLDDPGVDRSCEVVECNAIDAGEPMNGGVELFSCVVKVRR